MRFFPTLFGFFEFRFFGCFMTIFWGFHDIFRDFNTLNVDVFSFNFWFVLDFFLFKIFQFILKWMPKICFFFSTQKMKSDWIAKQFLITNICIIANPKIFYTFNQFFIHFISKQDKLLNKLEESEPEPPTSQEDECVICINARATMQTSPCGHRVVCRRCFVKTIQSAVAQRLLPLRCVICRARINRLISGSGTWRLQESASNYSVGTSRSWTVCISANLLYWMRFASYSTSWMSCD